MGKRRSGFDHIYLLAEDGTFTRSLRHVAKEYVEEDMSVICLAPRRSGGPRPRGQGQLNRTIRGAGGRSRRVTVPAILKPAGMHVSPGREALQRNDQQQMWKMVVDGLGFSDTDDDSGAPVRTPRFPNLQCHT